MTFVHAFPYVPTMIYGNNVSMGEPMANEVFMNFLGWLVTLLQKTFVVAGGFTFLGAGASPAPSCRF
jgi:hypothetical protein